MTSIRPAFHGGEAVPTRITTDNTERFGRAGKMRVELCLYRVDSNWSVYGVLEPCRLEMFKHR